MRTKGASVPLTSSVFANQGKQTVSSDWICSHFAKKSLLLDAKIIDRRDQSIRH